APREELAAIFFTSGTTGQPKGCEITHASLCSQVEAIRYSIPLDRSCRLASVLPLSHLFEMTAGLLYPLSQGAAIHYVPSRKGPDIVRVLQEQRITHMLGVPQLFGLMGKALDDQLRARMPGRLYGAISGLAGRLPLRWRRLLFSSVHAKLGGHLIMMASGGAALPPETLRLWERIGIRMIEGYGTSECSPVVCIGSSDGSTPIGSVGKPLHGVEVKLSPEGELLVRGPNVMRGYWRDPKRTEAVLKDGWYYTGDMATVDAEGNVRLNGRARDLIVLPSGMKVWPQDVEEALTDDPAVKDAAVIAVPTVGGGARLHAYLIPAMDRSEDPRAIAVRASAHLAQHQRVSSASWWPEGDFPRTSIMKVRRHLLPMPDAAGTAPTEPALVEDPVFEAVASTAQVATVAAEHTLADLGLDSMGLVQLALALEERTGKAVGDQALRLDMTVEQVRQFVDAAPGLARGPRRTGAPAASDRGKARATMWPYTWGRVFRFLSFPFDFLFWVLIQKTIVQGGEHLSNLPKRVIFAGTHHSFADVPLIRFSLEKTPARRFAKRLVVAAAADGFGQAGLYGKYGILAFGLYPLRRQGAGKESLEELVGIAEAGNAVLIFAQGVHSRPEAERSGDRSVAFKMGTALLARDLGAAVVPFGLAGTEVAMPAFLQEYRGLVIAGIPISVKRVPLAICYGEPLSIGADESLQDFTRRLQDASYGLTREAEEALAKYRNRGRAPRPGPSASGQEPPWK
ncbi:MAG TPA: AMP-binding protein, partial [Chloroflexota bacterium]